MKNQQPSTHERYLHPVRDVVITLALDRQTITAEQAERLAHTKSAVRSRRRHLPGRNRVHAWENGVGWVDIVEIAATGQESWIQLAGTIIHDLLSAPI